MRFFLNILVALLVISTNSVFSQEFAITLRYERADIFSNDFFVGEVINVTGEKRCIGFVFDGPYTIIEPAFLGENITDDVSFFLKSHFYNDENDIPLIVRINELFIYETRLADYSYVTRIVDLNCTFIIKDSTGYKDMFTAAYSTIASPSGITHQKNIALAFEHAFKHFYSRFEKGLLEPRTISREDLYNNPLTSKSKIEEHVKINIEKKAIYSSFYDLRDNTPDTTIHFAIRYKEKKNALNGIIRHTAKPVRLIYNDELKNVWGFSDGENMYCSFKDDYILLEKDNYSYYLGVSSIHSSNYITGVLVGGYSFGVSGLIVGGLLGGMFDVASAKESILRLNFSTGSFNPILTNKKPIISEIIFYASGTNKSKDGLKLSIDDEFYCILKPDTWCSLILPSSADSVYVVIVGPNKQETKAVIVPRLFNTDFYFFSEKKKKPPYISYANFEMRELLKRRMSDNNMVKSNNNLNQIQ